ncbi:hypothetical protein [Cohnella zeiphila]|uniref:Holin n=1 Tax=Cohnella zeiphila TaxID=2761120 RepID=A0A7X0SN03_9BACL|nr:hypothetical protein [Cohnella zeiphila]MBB6731879.1 hypothetical protein [Cohnella zeiphila]
MYEFYEWIRDHRHNPLTWAALVPLIIIIADKLGREFITDQFKKLLHVQGKADFKEYIANQKRIERKVDQIAYYLGVPEWNVEETVYTENTAKNSSILSRLGRLNALYARKSTMQRRRTMNNTSINYVTLVVALLGAAKIILESFGITVITDDVIDQASNAVAGIVTLLGVIMSHRKKENIKDVTIQSEA